MECIAGCKTYNGNETLHHKDCPFYPESLSKLYDKSLERIKELEREIVMLKTQVP